MSTERSGKRTTGTLGVKVLITATSIAATLAGWATLPANDPQSSAAVVNQSTQVTTVEGTGTEAAQATAAPTQVAGSQALAPASPTPIPELPQVQAPEVQAPSGFAGRPLTRTRSSR